MKNDDNSNSGGWTFRASDCLVCFEEFSEDGPKTPGVLHCGHTFCEECLRKMGKADSSDYVVYDCPICREITHIPASKNSGLPPKNYLVCEMLTQYKAFAAFQEKSREEAAARRSSSSSSKAASVAGSLSPSSGVSVAPPVVPTPRKAAGLSLIPMKVRSVDFDNDTIVHSRFMIRPNEVSKLGHDWLGTLWFGPSDLKARAQVPVRMGRAYVPCWLFFVNAIATTRLTSSSPPPPSASAETEGRTNLEVSFKDKLFFRCACADEKEREYFSKAFDSSWTLSNISIHSRAIMDPQGTSTASPGAVEAMEVFDHLSSIAAKSTVMKSSASFELLPPDAAVFPYVNVEEVWGSFEAEVKSLLEKKCAAVLEHKGYPAECVAAIDISPPKYESILIYMPVYDSFYTYSSGKFRISINGQNGKVCGDRPYDPLVSTIKSIFRF